MKIEELHNEWLTLGRKYSDDLQLLDSLWEILLKNYSGKSRNYHNLIHIGSMLKLAEENQTDIADYDAILFAIWFHDIIYKSSKKDNEEKSADFAKGSLQKLSVDSLKIEKIHQLIISTKKHQIILSEDKDNAFLLDFDLSVLGQS